MGAVASYNSFVVNILKKDYLFCLLPLKKRRDDYLCKVAEGIANQLQQKNRTDIISAQSDPLVLRARQFLKNLKVVERKGFVSRVDKCARELLAYQLSISSTVLDVPENAGFTEFAKKNALPRYLMEYKDSVIVDPTTNKISLKVSREDFPGFDEGKPSFVLTWDKIQKVMKTWKAYSPKPNMPWFYGMNGVQNKDMFHWTKLTPFKKESPIDRNILEISACSSTSPQLQGDHSWVVIRIKNGDVYSAGLYLEAKSLNRQAIPLSFAIKDAFIQQPDVSEFWPCKIDRLQMEISDNDFIKIKAEIENRKAKERESTVFQLMQSNCLLWSKSIAKQGENFDDLPTKVSGTRVLAPKRFEKWFDKISPYLPNIVIKVCSAVAGFFINLVLYIFGAGKVACSEAKKKNPDVKPHLESIGDLFNVSKSELHHPFYFVNRVIPWVHKWRAEQVKVVEARVDLSASQKAIEIAHIKYRLPPISYPI